MAKEMNDVIRDLENDLMPQFKTVAARLSSRFPAVKVSPESGFTGPKEAPIHWGMYISCIFRDAQPEQIDLVDLSFEIWDIQTKPTINADICWGHPSGYIEIQFFENWKDQTDWPAATPEKIREVKDFLPCLFSKLEEVLAAGPQVEPGKDKEHRK